MVLRGVAATGAVVGLGIWGAEEWAHRPRRDADVGPSPFGPLRPVRDRTTGLELFRLPEGFSYATHGWTGDPLANGAPTPPGHDGMGVVRADGAVVSLVRNHELRGGPLSFADPAFVFDRRGPAGTTTLAFDMAAGAWVGPAHASLGGTSGNCSGGATPWGTWLSCEETLERRREPHGWVFEVPPDGASQPEPLVAMGRFNHEAAAVDPRTSIVYMTEDQPFSGFYRFVPAVRGDLRRGGRLEMLAVAGRPRAGLRSGVAAGTSLPVTWVPIPEPERSEMAGVPPGCGVWYQGREHGGASFRRLEGGWWGHDRVWFTATEGGAAEAGQLWTFEPEADRLTLVYESPSKRVLDLPDQGTASPRGGVLVCEDGQITGQRVIGFGRDGRPFAFAESNVRLAGERNGFAGDFRTDEMTGLTFHEGWLFMNVQKPGFSVAITGPWRDGWV